MATWGVHSFENDDAVEWAAAYREMGFDLAASTIRIALEDFSNNRLSASIGTRAIAAVEAVAQALGRGSEAAAVAFDGAPAPDPAKAEALVAEANELVMAVTGASELAQLWKEADPEHREAWMGSLTDLRRRLNGAPAAAPAPSPETAAPPAAASADVTLDDIRKAIGGLARDIEALRRETAENFDRLARRLPGADR
ncbi:MAG: DUF4259 domain-containing protein [Paracoccaceae bacterium]|nr:DUF4259 domain-containing protein [Paracoccaceae bacterium]